MASGRGWSKTLKTIDDTQRNNLCYLMALNKVLHSTRRLFHMFVLWYLKYANVEGDDKSHVVLSCVHGSILSCVKVIHLSSICSGIQDARVHELMYRDNYSGRMSRGPQHGPKNENCKNYKIKQMKKQQIKH